MFLRVIRMTGMRPDHGVDGAVPFNGHRPVVYRSEKLDACGARAGAPSAESGEQDDCGSHRMVSQV